MCVFGCAVIITKFSNVVVFALAAAAAAAQSECVRLERAELDIADKAADPAGLKKKRAY